MNCIKPDWMCFFPNSEPQQLSLKSHNSYDPAQAQHPLICLLSLMQDHSSCEIRINKPPGQRSRGANAACVRHLQIDSVLIPSDSSPNMMDVFLVFGTVKINCSQDNVIITDNE